MKKTIKSKRKTYPAMIFPLSNNSICIEKMKIMFVSKQDFMRFSSVAKYLI